MKESEMRTRAKALAVRVLTECEKMGTCGGRSVLINQIVRSVTSIGANMHEANYAASKADFINKLQIALKECYETEYWLDMMQSVSYITEETSVKLSQECGIIRRMLVKAINTTKGNI